MSVYEGVWLDLWTDVLHDVNIRRCSCRLTVTQRAPLVEQELLNLPVTRVHLRFMVTGFDVVQSLVFCAAICISLFVLLSFFCLGIALSIVCPSIYCFLLSLSYLQFFLDWDKENGRCWIKRRTCMLIRVINDYSQIVLH